MQNICSYSGQKAKYGSNTREKRNKIEQATAADHLEQKFEPFQIPLSYPGLESTRSYDQVSYDIIPKFFFVL